jgi:hypothetical protein
MEVNEEGSEAAAVTSIDIDIRIAGPGTQMAIRFLTWSAVYNRKESVC